ncbi:response regulator [Pseudaminobacter salicylatoxidans]|uniref:response regulator n=1 Tax=Pseudaminobacter salicylatoxidans TaxID=93369 RepID=UPI0002F9C198|nr:response regulator [Pseudaminobacter salicylatoxidans]
MTQSSLDPKHGGGVELDAEISDKPVIDFSRALVVGRSQINRVVVSKILENAGLRPVSMDLEAALKALETQPPGTIVLDGGADNTDCDALMEPLVQLRRMADPETPRVLLLSTRMLRMEDLAAFPAVDAVVMKPITPERLQTVLERLGR